jgi:hypothetical protein
MGKRHVRGQHKAVAELHQDKSEGQRAQGRMRQDQAHARGKPPLGAARGSPDGAEITAQRADERRRGNE